MNAKQAMQCLLNDLESKGAFLWHNNKQSYYIKFKDQRIGSIRLSNHKSRSWYNYKYEVIKYNGNFTKKDIKKLVNRIIYRINNLVNYKPDQIVVYDKDRKKYIKIK